MRKRFIVTNTLGRLLVVVVFAASTRDRDGAKPVLLDTYLRTLVRFVFADGGFVGGLLDWAQHLLATTLHIGRKPADQHGFAVIPRRWAVERSLARLTAHRRLARDYERGPAVSEAMIRWAAINTTTRPHRPRRTSHPSTTTHLDLREQRPHPRQQIAALPRKQHRCGQEPGECQGHHVATARQTWRTICTISESGPW